MKHSHSTPSCEGKTTTTHIAQWVHALNQLHDRLASRFARPEPHRRALLYVQGLLSPIERKNGWQIAEHAREATPYGMQRLLVGSVWDEDLVRDDLRAYVLERLGTKAAVLAIDETSFPKRGTKSAGVQVQYCGTTGQLENCQVGVFLSYITVSGHALIDRELYLPLSWIQDRDRCQDAGIPETVRFQTKCELAVQMLKRIWQAQLPICWVVADSVYGGNLDLRTWCERHQYSYVFAVACNEPVGIRATDGQRYWVESRDVEARLLQPQDWQRLAMSEGTKGPRLFDWACVPLLHGWQEDGRHFLLLRRTITDAPQISYFLVFALKDSPLLEMVQACGTRWHIEEDFEASKDMGLDHAEVRSFIGWYRHITLVMLAYAFLTGMRVLSPPLSVEQPPPLSDPFPKPLTTSEIRHLLGWLIWPPPRNIRALLSWSWWRRCHQGRATYYHTKRRLEAG